MKIRTTKNQIYKGSSNRLSVIDVYSPAKDGAFPLVIFVHGFKGFKDWGHFPTLFQCIALRDFHVISFNLSHNGGTADEVIDFPDLEAFSNNTYSKELFDTEKVLTWIKHQEINYTDISIIGHSRGGGIAVLAASRNEEIKKLVTWAAVDNFVDRLPEKTVLDLWKQQGVYFIKNGRTKQDMPMKYSLVEDLEENSEKLSVPIAASKVNIPSLIIHGENDEAVALNSARSLAQKIKGSQLEIISNTGHTFDGKHPFEEKDLPEASKQLLEKTIAFLKL